MDNFSEEFFSPDTNTEIELEPTAKTPEVEEVETTEPEAVETETDTVEAEAAVTQAPKMVPLSAVQAERKKAKEAYDQINALRQQIAAFEASKREVPDPYDDPAAFGAHQQQLIARQVQEALIAQRFIESQARAVLTHGQAFIDEVSDWATEVSASDPTFGERAFAQADPAAWVIEQKQRSELLKSFEADPDDFVRRRALELGYATLEETEAPQLMARKPLGPQKSCFSEVERPRIELTINTRGCFRRHFS